MPNKSLTDGEIDRLPQCSKDWLWHPCDFKAQHDKAPTLHDCYDCMFEGFFEALDHEKTAAATHLLEALREMVRESLLHEH